MTFKPIKPRKEVFKPSDCVGCISRPKQSVKECGSCGNWDNNYKQNQLNKLNNGKLV